MKEINKMSRVIIFFVGFIVWLSSSPAWAEHLTHRQDGVAIQGYDTVAYFTDGRATRGQPDFEHVWGGWKWWFASAEHRDMFAREPDRYAPHFGGYCTGGLSLGVKVVADPENWHIVDGELHLYHSEEGREQAIVDPEPVIAKAEETWERLGSN